MNDRAAAAWPLSGQTYELLRATDWSKTALGPLTDWPPSLRMAAGIVLGSRIPMAINWGPQLVQLYNDGYGELLGVRHPAALGRPLAQNWPEVWESVEPVHRQVLATGQPVYMHDQEFVLQSRGSPEARYFTISLSPIVDETGLIRGVLTTAIETTQRVQAEHDWEHQKSIERTHGFLLRLEDAIQPLADPNEIMATASRLLGSYLQVNRCAYAVVEPDEDHFVITGDYICDTFSICGRFAMSAFGQTALALMRSGDVYVVDDVTRDARITADDLTAYRATDIGAVISVPLHKRGRFVAGMAVHQRAARHWTPGEIDLVRTVVNRCWETLERVHAQLDLADRQRQLVEADRRKDEFLAMLAHELRNPLAPLTNALRLLERSADLTGRGQAALAMAARQTRQLTRLVDDLLEISRITRGKIELRREPMSVGAAVHLAAESIAPMIEQRSQEIEIAVPAKPVRIMADPARIAQVLENLLVNASKYTSERGAIRIEVEDHANEVEVRVIDNGIGIEPDKIAHLFELFHQIDATLDRAHGGLGIGLALVKRLVELHGGNVEATSAGRGQGATFIVRLPSA